MEPAALPAPPQAITSVGLPHLTPRAVRQATPVPTVELPRTSLGFAAVEQERCPCCGVQDASVRQRATLRRMPPWSRSYLALMNPLTMLAGALALLPFAQTRPLGGLLFLFGPMVAISSAGMHQMRTGLRFRLNYTVCTPCAAVLRQQTQRMGRWRLLRNTAAFGLVMLAPVGLQVVQGLSLLPLALCATVLAATVGVAHSVERGLDAAASARLPTLEALGPAGATIRPPAWWTLTPAKTPLPQGVSDRALPPAQ